MGNETSSLGQILASVYVWSLLDLVVQDEVVITSSCGGLIHAK